MPLQLLLAHRPPQLARGPQELPQPLPHVVKQPLVQSVPHPPEHVALEQPLVLSLKHVE